MAHSIDPTVCATYAANALPPSQPAHCLPLMRVLSFCFLLLVAHITAYGQITTRTDAVGQKLNAWYAAGEAAGLQALSYENRDGGHSVFEAKNYPQLTIIQPTEEEWAKKKNVGPAGNIRREPVFGNCSMAAPADREALCRASTC